MSIHLIPGFEKYRSMRSGKMTTASPDSTTARHSRGVVTTGPRAIGTPAGVWSGKMDRRPGPYLMIVGQCRDNFVRELLRIDQGFLRQSVADRHDQFPTHGCQRAIGQSAGRRVAHRCARADPNVGRCDGDAGRSREIGALIQSVYAAINARAAFAAPCTGPSAPMVTRLR
jgi:hypothetical protein